MGHVHSPIHSLTHLPAAFTSACESAGMPVEPEVFPAATDSRFLRQRGINAVGFSPMPNTPILLHDHDEYIDESVFMAGISAYETIIKSLSGDEYVSI